MSGKNILSELDGLIKRASAKKTEELKKAAQDGGISAKLDNAEDGTSPATTGAQAAAMEKAEKETYADNMVDTGAKDNKPGESVSASTEGATAVATDGQSGTEGAELEPKKEADNGPTLGDTPEGNGFNSGSFKTAAAAMRKQAAELRKQAEALLTPLDRFLVKAARSNPDAKLRKQAEAVPDDELAGSAADSLLQQIESGQLGDEEAAQIIQEAVQAGAITEDELAEAAQATGGADPAAAGGAPPVSEDQLMEAKLAAADVGPNDPKYLSKLASFYPAEINAGYAFALKLAQEMSEGGGEEKKEEAVEEEAKAEGEPVEEEKKEKEEVAEEKGEEEGEEKAEEAAPAAAPAVAPPAGALPPAPVGDMAALAPVNPEEQAALGAVQQELGLDDAALAQLMAAPAPEAAKLAMAKVAKAMKTAGVDYATRARTLILTKVAAVRR